MNGRSRLELSAGITGAVCGSAVRTRERTRGIRGESLRQELPAQQTKEPKTARWFPPVRHIPMVHAGKSHISRASDSDAQLVLAFRNGDESAFEALYERHHRAVLNVAYRFLGDRDAAEDLAQEVFLKLYASPGSYKPTAKLSTWLYRVTHNACIDEIRKRRNRPVELPPAIHSPGTSEPDELAEAVRAAVASLPEKQRTAVVLQRYEDLSYQEIAEVLGTSVPAVESLLFRARQTLKTILSQYLR